jgi:ureidoacrylate peracid hydrolase
MPQKPIDFLDHKDILDHVEKELPVGGVKWDIGPDKMALVCIDMQKAFVSVGGNIEVPLAREIVPNINRLGETCRKAKIPVIWVCRIHRRDGSDEGLHHLFWPMATKGEMGLLEGTKGAELYEGLRTEPTDYWVKKIRFSAFTRGSSDLEPLLRGLGRDTIMVTGVATNVCCGTTMINGMELDFKVIAVSDGLATFSKEAHEGFVSLAGICWAQVMSTDELVREIEARTG